ncbi:MAG: hypothetical protein U0835_22255 [Isosphaeraceae bacterium]
MAPVLNTKYTGPGSYRLFLTNRALRLTWLLGALAATVLLCSFSSGPRARAGCRSTRTLYHAGVSAYLVFTQVVIVGQETTMFLAPAADGLLHLSTDFWASRTAALLVPDGGAGVVAELLS